MGGVTLPILKVGRPFVTKRGDQNRFKGAFYSMFLTVARSTLITATLLV